MSDDEGASMSAINGDKARFHRKRKSGIARRARNRERLNALAFQSKPAVRVSSEKKAVSA
jgi:hypothetical protein